MIGFQLKKLKYKNQKGKFGKWSFLHTNFSAFYLSHALSGLLSNCLQAPTCTTSSSLSLLSLSTRNRRIFRFLAMQVTNPSISTTMLQLLLSDFCNQVQFSPGFDLDFFFSVSDAYGSSKARFGSRYWEGDSRVLLLLWRNRAHRDPTVGD